MQHHSPTHISRASRPRRSHGHRRLDLLAPVPDDRTAAAMDDEHEAMQLIDDLAALVDAGLITPVDGDGDGEVRFAVFEPDSAA